LGRGVGVQVALDVRSLDLAIEIAQEVLELVDRLEVGTPLLSAHGGVAVTEIRQAFPDAVIIVDCKLMDRGGEETAHLIDAGANGVIVQAAAPSATVGAACEAASSLEASVMLDGLGAQGEKQIAEMIHLPAISHYIVHKGKDEQAASEGNLLQAVRDAAALKDMPPLAAAGGLSPSTIPAIVGEPSLDLIIVGEAMVMSGDPRRTAMEIRALCQGET